MKYIVAIASLSASICAHAAPDQRFCEMVGSLAHGTAQDRIKGVPYKTEWRRMKAAVKGLPNEAGMLKMSKAVLDTVYVEMPQLSPEGAYKFHYVACMSAP